MRRSALCSTIRLLDGPCFVVHLDKSGMRGRGRRWKGKQISVQMVGAREGREEEVWYHNTCPHWGLGFIARKSEGDFMNQFLALLYDMQKKTGERRVLMQ